MGFFIADWGVATALSIVQGVCALKRKKARDKVIRGGRYYWEARLLMVAPQD